MGRFNMSELIIANVKNRLKVYKILAKKIRSMKSKRDIPHIYNDGCSLD